MKTRSLEFLESFVLGSAVRSCSSSAGIWIRQLRIITRGSFLCASPLGKLALDALRYHYEAKPPTSGALHLTREARTTMKPSYLLFVTAMFFSVAVAATAQSTAGGTYDSKTEVLANANEHLSCPTTLQFDPKTNSATVTVNYRGTDLTSKIAGSFRGDVFHGRSEGRFSGLVYVQAVNYELRFDRRSGTVKATSWSVNPAPGSDNKPETDVYRRTRPQAEGSEGREGGNSGNSEDNSSGDSNRSAKNKDGSKNPESAAKPSHLKDDTRRETKASVEPSKLVKLDSPVSKPKPVTTSSHKK